jgi:hypothetical protein
MVIDHISDTQLLGMLEDVAGGCGVTGIALRPDELEPGSGILYFRVLGHLCTLAVGDGTWIAFSSAFGGTKATLRQVNRWNRRSPFPNVSLDRKGVPVMTAFLSLKGSATDGGIRDFLETCATLIALWLEEFGPGE